MTAAQPIIGVKKKRETNNHDCFVGEGGGVAGFEGNRNMWRILPLCIQALTELLTHSSSLSSNNAILPFMNPNNFV